ncbi:MAG: CHASE2 domain-containing protein [Bordetella sp.]|uniref:CHASE2 domain-containing protein n=1 Tax=Bordetella sp. TaxID=28081 RepID=UPI003F7BC81B
MAQARERRRRLAWSADHLLIALLIAVATLLGSFNGLGRFDQGFYDQAMAWSSRKASPDILLVTVDSASLDALGPWPWPHGVLARLLDKLDGARAVGLTTLHEASALKPGDDALLISAIERNGHVVLPAVLDSLTAPTRSALASDKLAAAAADAGYLNSLPDGDGIIRRVQWDTRLRNGRDYRYLVLALLAAGGERDKADAILRRAGPAGRTGIDYVGPSGRMRAVSYLQVLRGQVPAAQIQGKYVLVGSQPDGWSRRFPTPMGRLSGIEMLGQQLQAARAGLMIRTAPAWLTALGTALCTLLACLALRRMAPRRALLLSLAAAALVVAAAFAVLNYAHYWIAPSASVLMLLASYPLWCWRQQEAILADMDSELLRLRQEYPPILDEAQLSTHFDKKDAMSARLHELRQALTRVRNLRRFLVDGFDGITDPVFVSDKDGRLSMRNRAATAYFRDLALRAPRLGQSTTWLLEQLVSDAAVLNKIGPALTGQQSDASPWRLDMEIHDRQGRSIILKCAPIHNSAGEFAGTVVTFNDISAIRQAESKREETLRFVSHDMRAPQNSILALVYLNSQETDPKKQHDAWSRIGQLARRTLRLVDDFVHLTRAESVRLAQVVIDVDMLLHEAMDDFWGLAQARRVELSIDDALPQALLRGDRALLLRAVCNLIDNALKYTSSGGRVRVSLRRDGMNWLIHIVDSGMGIAQEDLPCIFQPFMRVGPAARSDSNGAGLGLAFVNTVAARHGGSVEVDSRPGAGSTFTLRLPAYTEDEIARADDRAA